MSKLIYCATPARLSSKKKEIMDFVTAQDYGPFHPFQAFEYERFEGGPIGRDGTMDFCRRAIEICDEFWMFGVSRGTLDELIHAKKIKKPIKLLLDQFDSEWKMRYNGLKQKYGDPLAELNPPAPNIPCSPS
jgi:hypothetical protein